MTRIIEDHPAEALDNYAQETASDDSDDDSEPSRLERDRVCQYPEIWQEILQGDVIAKTRSLVNACRKSPQRRESLRNWIASGKESGKWECKPLQLLRDVDTRWSSVYFMIDRYLYLHQVSSVYNPD